MYRILACFTAVGILLGSGLVYRCLGKDSEQLDAAIARIERVPMAVGEWRAQNNPVEQDERRAFENAGAKGYWTRTYVHQRTKVSVLVILMCGRPGKMAVHTPEVCYGSAGYHLTEQPATCDVKNEQGQDIFQCWTGQFTKKSRTANRLRLYWAWNAQGQWEAPVSPRWHFLGEPYLYKLYVSRDLGTSPKSPASKDPALDLVRDLLPGMNAALFPVEALASRAP